MYSATLYWGIISSLLQFGNTTIFSKPTGGIVDTGTTLILLSHKLFTKYKAAIPGATFNTANSTSNVDNTLLKIPQA